MTTPDTTETDDQLIEAIEAWVENRPDLPILIEDAIAPALAAIRRHAAAEALKHQAWRLAAVNSAYMKQLKHYKVGTDAYSLTVARAGQATADASRLRAAARDIIAEGWEHTCYATWAATRDDPGYGCETPVENEGDFCSKHEPQDDDRGDD